MTFSANPQKAVTRLLNCFFCSSRYLMSTLGPESQGALSFWQRQRNAFHCREINILPNKIKTRSQLLNTRVLQGASTQQVQTITANLRILRNRLQMLPEASSKPQAKILTNALLNDSQRLRIQIEQSFQQLLNQAGILI